MKIHVFDHVRQQCQKIFPQPKAGRSFARRRFRYGRSLIFINFIFIDCIECQWKRSNWWNLRKCSSSPLRHWSFGCAVWCKSPWFWGLLIGRFRFNNEWCIWLFGRVCSGFFIALRILIRSEIMILPSVELFFAIPHSFLHRSRTNGRGWQWFDWYVCQN